ncbi:MAG: voltage-gated potassium channel [Abditibacteriota bacterium]|nr:voltage-gated potassium channel [Abditibacteriota bacterium]
MTRSDDSKTPPPVPPEQESVVQERSERERRELLEQLEDRLEAPMLVLGVLWLGLLVVELIWGLNRALERVGTAIWIVFILDFAIKFVLAPRKSIYLRHNWLTALALLLPALRVLRIARLARLLRATRTVRGLRMFRLLSSFNRGFRALNATLGRRGFGYVVILTVVTTFSGAAGMYAFERESTGFTTYAQTVWWTAMLMTTLGSEAWPQSGEGRVLCFLLALYAFTVFGYVTATLATFFIGRDAQTANSDQPLEGGSAPHTNGEAGPAPAETLESLRQEIMLLRAEIRLAAGHAHAEAPSAQESAPAASSSAASSSAASQQGSG